MDDFIIQEIANLKAEVEELILFNNEDIMSVHYMTYEEYIELPGNIRL